MSETQPVRESGLLLRHRPALAAAVALILGIVSYHVLPRHPVAWIALAGVLAALSLVLIRSRASSISIFVAIYFCGVAVGQLRAFYFPGNHIGQYAPQEARLVRVDLVVTETPKILSDPFAKSHRESEHQSFRAVVQQIETTDGWQACSGTASVHLSQPRRDLRAGQTIRVLGYLQRPAPAMNPGEFDWAGHLRAERTLVTLHVPHPQHVTILAVHSPSILQRFRDDTRDLLARGFIHSQSIDHAMLLALLLGDNDPQLRDVRAAFQHTGTAHLLAISGLHVVIVWYFIFTICRVLRVRPMVTAILTSATVVLYALAALPSTPAIRAAVLCIAFTVALLLRRRVDSIQLLSIICFGMLIFDPMALFTPGFQLSFVCVLGLMAAAGKVALYLRGWRDRDVEIAASFRPAGGFAALLRGMRSHFEQAFAGAIVAWVVSIPIVESHFSQLNAWSIPCALLLSPLTFLSIVGGLLKIILTALWPWWAHAWAIGAGVPISILRHAAEWLSRMPWSNFPLRAPPGWAIGAYFVAIAIALVPVASPILKRATISLVAMAIIALAIFPIVAGAAETAKLRITLLSVGNGRCIIVQPPGTEPIMIDCGSAKVPELEHSIIAPFLSSNGIDHISWLILSDGDLDDINAAADVARDLAPRLIFSSVHLRNPADETYATHRLLQELGAMHITPQPIGQNQRIELDRDDTLLESLWPPLAHQPTGHDSGLVLKISFAGKSILLPANIGVSAQKELLKHPERLKADILLAPHHGAVETTTADFIAAVDPSIVLSSGAARMTEKQKALDNLTSCRKLYRTGSCGAITITIDASGTIAVTPFLRPG